MISADIAAGNFGMNSAGFKFGGIRLNHFNRQGGKNGGKKIKTGGNHYFRG
jgi:hypothetical protein